MFTVQICKDFFFFVADYLTRPILQTSLFYKLQLSCKISKSCLYIKFNLKPNKFTQTFFFSMLIINFSKTFENK